MDTSAEIEAARQTVMLSSCQVLEKEKSSERRIKIWAKGRSQFFFYDYCCLAMQTTYSPSTGLIIFSFKYNNKPESVGTILRHKKNKKVTLIFSSDGRYRSELMRRADGRKGKAREEASERARSRKNSERRRERERGGDSQRRQRQDGRGGEPRWGGGGWSWKGLVYHNYPVK